MKKTNKCDVNFGRLKKRNVKVFVGDNATKSVEIIGQKGNYSVWTDGSSKALSNLKGKTGTLKEVKSAVSDALCGSSVEPKKKTVLAKIIDKTLKAPVKPVA